MAKRMGKVFSIILFLSFPGNVTVSTRAQAVDSGLSSVLQTLEDLWNYEHAGRPKSQQISFELPEGIVNLYLSTSLRLKPRPGLKSLSVELLPGNRVVATADVDFQSLVREDPTVISAELRPRLMRASFLKAEFDFRVESGLLAFSVKPVVSGGLDIPTPVLEKIVRQLASIQPEKLDTSRPIPLPWGMKKLYTRAKLLGGET